MSTSSQMEREWQFAALDTRPVARWLSESRVLGYQVFPAGEIDMHDVYYDTADWAIHRAGYTCRVRRHDEVAEATLKSMAEATDGLRQRQEITEQFEFEELDDLRTLPGAAGEFLRAVAGRHEVRPIFEIETHRRLFHLADEAGPLGEVALDSTTIPVGNEDHPVRLARVEVEVHTVQRAQRFVDDLRQTLSLHPATTSKFEAALIATGQVVTSVFAELGTTIPEPEMTAADYACALLRRHFHTLVDNEPGTRLGANPKHLHDMRVATRRIRATMSAFDPYLPPPLRRLRTEMGWLTRSLGDVRDLDVQIERLQGWRAQLSQLPPGSLDALEGLLLDDRKRARKRMLAVLDSRRYQRLLERFATALQRGTARSNTASLVPVLQIAPELITRRYRRVRRKGDAINARSPADAYHQLRIEAKKLRYAVEFGVPLYGTPAQEFAGRVTRLQDLLGLHQDADVAVESLTRVTRNTRRRLPPDTLVAVGIITERYRVHAAELREQFPETYRQIRGAPWKALRANFRELDHSR